MKYWPLPNSNENHVPGRNELGAFWRDTADGFNAGIDLYAPSNSEVIAIEKGIVVDIGKFTIAKEGTGLNTTYFVVVRTEEKVNYKYCQVNKIAVGLGTKVEAGQLLAKTTPMIDDEDISVNTSFFIKELSALDIESRLHLEVYKSPFTEVKPYNSGIYLGEEKPKSILDPRIYMQGLKKPIVAESRI